MAIYLYRLGKWAYQNRLKVIGGWIAVLILAGVGAATLSGATSDSFSIPGIASEKAQNTMTERFPDKKSFDKDVSITYVVQAPQGHTLFEPQYQKAVQDMVGQLKTVDGVDKPDTIINPLVAFGTPDKPGPLLQQTIEFQRQTFGFDAARAGAVAADSSPVTPDGRTAQFGLGFVTTDPGDVSDKAHEETDTIAQNGRDAGLTVEMKGTGLKQPEVGIASEAIGLVVAAIVLIITFASAVAWGIPIFTALIGVAIGVMGVTIATGFIDLSSQTSILATMLGLAVGIDYALFIVSRYRHERLRHDPADAAGRAVGTAGSAVVFAGLTVIIALVALSIVNIPFLTAMGLAAAGTVFMAVLIALTLVPAVLGLLRGKAFAARIPRLNPPDEPGAPEDRTTNGRRWVTAVVRRPWVAVVGAVVLLAVIAGPMIGGLQLALPNDGNQAKDKTQRQAYDIVTDAYGPGYNGGLAVVADGRGITGEQQRAAAYAQLTTEIEQNPDVKFAAVGAGDLSKNLDTAIITVIPHGGPNDDSTKDLVRSLRDAESGVQQRVHVSYGVTGQTAIENDVSDRLSGALLPYLLVVVGLAFILLVLVFRSILVPLTAALGFLLSVAATFGATVAVFSDGILGIVSDTQPLVSFMPIFLIGVVFGLAMDYQVFLVTRMREAYVEGLSPKEAVIVGFSHSGRVVAAAASVMTAVFMAFMLQDASFIKMMGFALAIAVVFDAVVVRMILIPALLALLGDRAWWLPGWLDRILPNVDVEGEGLKAVLDRPANDEREALAAGV